MIHVITVQRWSTPSGNIDAQPLTPKPNMADTAPSRDKAEQLARHLAEKHHPSSRP
jgi:hypothetical protein